MRAYDIKSKREVKVWNKMRNGHFVVETKLGELYTVRPEFLINKTCNCKNCTCK